MPLLGPGVGKENERAGERVRRQRRHEEARIIGKDPDVAKIALFDLAEETRDAGLEHLAANESRARLCRGLSDQMLAGAEADFEPYRAAFRAKKAPRVERFALRQADAETRQESGDERASAGTQSPAAPPAIKPALAQSVPDARCRVHAAGLAGRAACGQGSVVGFLGGEGRKRLCQLEKAPLDLRIGDSQIGAHQLERLALHHRVRLIGLGGGFARTARRWSLAQLFEKKRDRNVEHARQIVKPAGADAIGAALVFLNLLERQADRIAELFLTHPEKRAAQAHARAHMHVDRVGLIRFLPSPWFIHVTNIRREAGSLTSPTTPPAREAIVGADYHAINEQSTILPRAIRRQLKC